MGGILLARVNVSLAAKGENDQIASATCMLSWLAFSETLRAVDGLRQGSLSLFNRCLVPLDLARRLLSNDCVVQRRWHFGLCLRERNPAAHDLR